MPPPALLLVCVTLLLLLATLVALTGQPSLLSALVCAAAVAVAVLTLTDEFGGIVKSLGPFVLPPPLAPPTPPPALPTSELTLLNRPNVDDVPVVGTTDGFAADVGVTEGVLIGFMLLLFKAAAADRVLLLLLFDIIVALPIEVGVVTPTTQTHHAHVDKFTIEQRRGRMDGARKAKK